MPNFVLAVFDRVVPYDDALRGALQEDFSQWVARHHCLVSSLGISWLVLCEPLEHVPQAHLFVEFDGNAVRERDGDAPVEAHRPSRVLARSLDWLQI